MACSSCSSPEPCFALKIGRLSCLCVLNSGSSDASGASRQHELVIEPSDLRREDSRSREVKANRPKSSPSGTLTGEGDGADSDGGTVSWVASRLLRSNTLNAATESRKLMRRNSMTSPLVRRKTTFDLSQDGTCSTTADTPLTYSSTLGRSMMLDGPSMMSEHCPEVDALKAEFLAAESAGQLLEANRVLERLESSDLGADPYSVLDKASVERVHRMAEQYEYSHDLLKIQPADLSIHEENPALNLKWGVEITGDVMKLIYKVTDREGDVLKQFAALHERDLQKAFNKGLKKAVTLGIDHPCDSIWRAHTQSQMTGAKSDNVTVSSGMDALDEDLGCLWYCNYTPPRGTCDVLGVEVPEPDEGHSRSAMIYLATSVTPLNGEDEDQSRGFEMTVAAQMQLPAIAVSFVSWTPTMAIRSYARKKMEQNCTDMAKFIQTTAELDGRMKACARTPFYNRIRQRLLKKNGMAKAA